MGAPPDGVDYVDALPGMLPEAEARWEITAFPVRSPPAFFGAAGTYLALACMVSNIIWAPAHVGDQLRVEADVAERHLTIVECRPPWRADVGPEWTRFPIAVAVHEGGEAVVVVLAGSQPSLPRLRPGAADEKR